MVSTPAIPDWTSDEGAMQRVRQMAAEGFTGVMTQMIAEAGDRDYEKGWLIENCSAEMRGQYQGAWAQLKFLEAAVVGDSDHPMDQYDAGTTAIGDFGSDAGRAESEQSEEDWPEPIWKSMNHEQRRNWLQRRRRRSVKSKRSEDPAEDNGRQSSEKPSSTQQQFFPGELSSSRRSLPEGGGGGATHSIPKEPEDMLAQPRRVCSSRGSEARLAVKDPDVRSKEFDIRDEYKGQDDGTAAWAAVARCRFG